MAPSNGSPIGDDTVMFGEEEEPRTDKFKHPYVVFFHIFFRVSAVTLYIVCGLFSDAFIATFVIVVLLLSMDFWTVKNITGRLLVGLWWGSKVDAEGNSQWIFKSKKGRRNPSESTIFWMALILVPLLWVILLIIAIFRFSLSWSLLVLIAISFNGANLYGYVKCKFDTNQSMGSLLTTLFRLKQNANQFQGPTNII